MIQLVQWLTINWLKIAVPAAALVATYALGLWLRGLVVAACDRWAARTRWKGSHLAVKIIYRPFIFWFLLLGTGFAAEASVLTADVKALTWKATATVFVVSFGWVLIALSNRLLLLYLNRINAPQPAAIVVSNVSRANIIIIGALGLLDVWGIPTTPLLLVFGVIILAATLVLRNAAPNIIAAFHLWATQQVKAGDYIKLETGEEGVVIEVNSSNTRIKAVDDSIVIVPNSQLLQHTVVVYGQPAKMARELVRLGTETPAPELSAARGNNWKASDMQAYLSKREIEIARLVAEGISNREIGEKLFIAENTVKVHVKNILKKLELRNRQQLAAYTVLQRWPSASNEDRSPELT